MLLDQGLPRSAAELLRKAGIDTLHVGEVGMAEAEDIDIIRKARTDIRVVVTLDADFHTLLALDGATTPSVIRIRIERLRGQALANLLLMVIDKCDEPLSKGSAVTVEHSRIRIRLLPLVVRG